MLPDFIDVKSLPLMLGALNSENGETVADGIGDATIEFLVPDRSLVI